MCEYASSSGGRVTRGAGGLGARPSGHEAVVVADIGAEDYAESGWHSEAD